VTWVISNFNSVHLETLLVLVQDRCTICAKCIIGSKNVWTHLMVLLGVKAEVEARFGLFGDNANLTQDRCTVCDKHTIGSEIILDASGGTPR
jgi:hypothetical protein